MSLDKFCYLSYPFRQRRSINPFVFTNRQSYMERAYRGSFAKNFNRFLINPTAEQHSDLRSRRSLPFDEPREFRRPCLSIASGENAIYLRVAFKFANRSDRIGQLFKRAMEGGFQARRASQN